jgi:large subunit ribosomal protein L21
MKDSFVVVTIGGSQHILSEGEEFTINHVDGKVGDTITIDDVLLHQDDDKTELGKPSLGYTVTAEIIKQFHGPKMHVRTFKAKSRYRRKKGHRQPLTTLKVTKIAKKTAKKPTKKSTK